LEGLGEVFTQELSTGEVLTQEIFTPEDIFDYIYAVLHSKTYRETYKEFLKIDFPRVSFDVDKKTFFKMVEL
jgi:predicted helicase